MTSFSQNRLPVPHEFEKEYVISFDRLNTVNTGMYYCGLPFPFSKSFLNGGFVPSG